MLDHRWMRGDFAGSTEGLSAFAERVWREINLPNLRNHIVRDRDVADFIVRKRRDHSVDRIEAR